MDDISHPSKLKLFHKDNFSIKILNEKVNNIRENCHSPQNKISLRNESDKIYKRTFNLLIKDEVYKLKLAYFMIYLLLIYLFIL